MPVSAKLPSTTRNGESADGVQGSRRIGRPLPLADGVVAALQEDIAAARLLPREKLPTEPALSSLFGVSRTVIREAISRLKADGLVTSRQGAGVFVSDAPMQRAFRIRDEELDNKLIIRQIFELRLCSEVEAAALAAARRSPSDVDGLARWLDEIDATKHGADFGVEADVEFHRTIAAATQNTKLVDFQRYLSVFLRESIRVARGNTFRQHQLVDLVVDEHKTIFDAIRRRDVAAARNGMRWHLLQAQRRLGLIGPSEIEQLVGGDGAAGPSAAAGG